MPFATISTAVVNKLVLARLKRFKDPVFLSNFISPIVATSRTDVAYFSETDEDQHIYDTLTSFDADTQMMDWGIQKGTGKAVANRLGTILYDEDSPDSDDGLITVARLVTKVTNAIHRRRAYGIANWMKTTGNFETANVIDIGADSVKWNVANANPQNDVQSRFDLIEAYIELDPEDPGMDIVMMVTPDIDLVIRTKILSSIVANVGQTDLVSRAIIAAHFGVREYRVAGGKYNSAEKGSGSSTRTALWGTNKAWFWQSSREAITTSTPAFKFTARYTGKDRSGMAAVAGWTERTSAPKAPGTIITARDWLGDITPENGACVVLTNVI